MEILERSGWSLAAPKTDKLIRRFIYIGSPSRRRKRRRLEAARLVCLTFIYHCLFIYRVYPRSLYQLPIFMQYLLAITKYDGWEYDFKCFCNTLKLQPTVAALPLIPLLFQTTVASLGFRNKSELSFIVP